MTMIPFHKSNLSVHGTIREKTPHENSLIKSNFLAGLDFIIARSI
jgi:hypothetical protein